MDEQETTRLLDRLAQDIPVAPAPVEVLVADGHRAVRRRRVLLAAAASVAVLLGAGVPAYLASRTPMQEPYAVGQEPTADRTGALESGGMAGCIEQYTPDAVDRRAFAVDGVVVDIGDEVGGHDAPPYVEVTFAVQEWFRGGSGSTVTVAMLPPDGAGGAVTSVGGPSYGLGSRLLVSGGMGREGEALTGPIAWSCGFTRYYDPETAAAWR